jgi:hypothetical protein
MFHVALCPEWCRVFGEKLIIAQMINTFPALYRIRTFIPVFTKIPRRLNPIYTLHLHILIL